MPTDTRPAMHPTAALVAALRFALDAIPTIEGHTGPRYVEAHGETALCIAREPSPDVDAILEHILRPLAIVPDPHARVDGRAVPAGMACTLWRWAEGADLPVRVEATATGVAFVYPGRRVALSNLGPAVV